MRQLIRRTTAYALAAVLLGSVLPIPCGRASETEPALLSETVPPVTEELLVTQPTDATEASTQPPETSEETLPEVTETADTLWETEEPFLFPEEIPDSFCAPFARQPASAASAQAAAASYDSRDCGLITAVKDQTPWQLCWAFSALAVGESHLIRSGQSAASVDLSERHLGYYFHGDAYDPLGNADGDGTYLAEDYLISGNNNKFTTFALANWVGGAAESRYPYDQDPAFQGPEGAMDDMVHLTNAWWINARDRESIKYYITRNGSVGLSIYYLNAFYKEDTAAYFNDRYTATNHAITVIGWDDRYSAENFRSLPEGDGAWLCKNSVGTEFGNGGYFWLSYYDAAITHSSATAFVFEFGSGANYSWNYHYDGGYGTSLRTIPSGGAIASVYTASGSPSGTDEQIRAIGMAVADADLSYSIQIYRDPSDPTDPTSGTPALASPQTGRTRLCGYYSVVLDEPVTVRSGESFAVVITLRSDGGNSVRYFTDESYNHSAWIRFVSHTEPGQTFALEADGWLDLAQVQSATRVKAYTVALSSRTVSALRFEEDSVLLAPGDTFRQEPLKTPEDADSCRYTWYSDDESVAVVAEDGTVTAVDHGQTTITVTALDGRVSASFHVDVKPKIQSLHFLRMKTRMSEGEQFQPSVQILPADAAAHYTPVLSSSDETVATIADGTVLALTQGTTQITAKAGNAEAGYLLTVTKSLAGAEVTAQPAFFFGEPVQTAVTVSLDGVTLEAGTDYVCSFRNNSTPGTATVTVTGAGLYSGTVTAEFSISVAVPRLLSVENTTSGLRITWEPVPGVAGYQLYRRKNGGTWNRVRTLNGCTQDACTDAGASSGGAWYEYRLCAFVKQRSTPHIGAFSGSLGQYRLATSQIRKLTVLAEGFGVTWKRIPGAEGYRLLRKENGQEPELLAVIEGGNALYYEDTTASETGVLYSYSVLGVKQETYLSAVSDEKSACIPEAPLLHSPVNGIRGIELHWDPAEHATGYEIFRSANGIRWTRIKTISGGNLTDWTDTACTSGTKYRYRVLALTKQGNVIYRGDCSETEEILRLSQPSLRKLTAAEQSFTVQWRRIPGAASYLLLRSRNGGEPEIIGQTSVLQLTDSTAVEPDTIYQYSVIAQAENGGISFRSAASATKAVCIPAPPVLHPLSTDGSKTVLRWEPAALATGYEVYRSKDGIRWTKIRTITRGDITEWTDTSRISASCRYRVVTVTKLDGMTFRSEPSGEVRFLS